MSESYARQVVTPLPAPDGYVVDFGHPQRRDVVATYTVMSIWLVLAFFFVLRKLYVDLLTRGHFGLDDVLLLIGWIASAAVQGTFYCESAIFIGVVGNP
ncbi:hypothetical protein BKA67DRAFT_660923 [Truncatella angustata]|uniref:Uncharacterized protein n=1 Tax=Truncatella angustata TaxID=152316 RepID=A0A9P8ZWN6_9PEZI|nr:uncharacterized protein BKA67DRAFT_660923 [Truncatella angustata]KAH6652158.1 hypothetical protein BKA67DRAFT_660923 [Truncatella angustata]KAH8205066.1 hypothetical protein TruAng_000789 [Truncatella angustata]